MWNYYLGQNLCIPVLFEGLEVTWFISRAFSHVSCTTETKCRNRRLREEGNALEQAHQVRI